MPVKQMVRYAFVLDTDSDGVDIMAVIGSTKNSSIAVQTTDTPINKVTVLYTAAKACLCSFAQMAFPMVSVEPMASPTIITVSMCMT